MSVSSVVTVIVILGGIVLIQKAAGLLFRLVGVAVVVVAAVHFGYVNIPPNILQYLQNLIQ